MLFSTSLAVFGLAALGSAHVTINTPLPFKESVTNNDNGPLNEFGTDFPCKAKGVYTPQGPSTPMALGSSQPLSFTGSAVHGGGSCQISITYDTAPTKNSVWKVIHSIHGGCPISEPGNLVGDATLKVPRAYTFTIPNELPPGEAVLAWTWFNRIGNREMYMNCAPITITAGATRRDEEALSTRNATQLAERDVAAYNSLPNMYVANTSEDCITAEGKSLIFPNPGKSAEKNDAIGGFGDAPACGDNNGGTAAGPSAPVVSKVTLAPSSSAAAPTASTKVSLPGGVFFPNPTKGASTTTPAPISTPSVSAPVQAPVPSVSAPVQAPTPIQTTTFTVIPTKATSVAPPAGTGTVGGGSALSGPCQEEGKWNCIGGTSFQQCASGSWSVVMQVAAGTACTPGASTFDIHHIGSKRRNVRFSGAHIRRHLRSS